MRICTCQAWYLQFCSTPCVHIDASWCHEGLLVKNSPILLLPGPLSLLRMFLFFAEFAGLGTAPRWTQISTTLRYCSRETLVHIWQCTVHFEPMDVLSSMYAAGTMVQMCQPLSIRSVPCATQHEGLHSARFAVGVASTSSASTR